MEKVSYESSTFVPAGISPNIVAVAKPPWANRPHSGKLERLILQLGAGKGKFSEVTGIPRSIGCIGNNRFILRRDPLSVERVKELIREFRDLNGGELWLTNYDNVDYLLSMAAYAVEIGVPEVYAVVLLEDIDKVKPVEGVRTVVELEYSEENIRKLEELEGVHGALITVPGYEFKNLKESCVNFQGEVYLDVLFPGSAKRLDFNVIEVRRVLNPSVEDYHVCLAGTLAVTADGYALPCPLLRNYVVADMKRDSIKDVLKKKMLKSFWRMTKDNIPTCATCPFKYICHDCRALEYQATGDIDGMEYCPILL